MLLLYPNTLTILLPIKYRAIYFNIVFNQEGNLFKNKKKELLLIELASLIPSISIFLTESVPTNSVVILTTALPPIIVFAVHIQPPTRGAPISINTASSLGLVLFTFQIDPGTLPYAPLTYMLTIVLYIIIAERKPPTALISTLSLIICTNGVSMTSNPLDTSSFIVISPALPRG